MSSNKPTIVAHRGLHTHHPENSLAAFKAAWDAGITWCECDVHLSLDGKAVVIHDETLERTTTGRGRVASFSWDELHKLRLLDAEGNATVQPLSLLDDLLAALPPEHGIWVETKPALGYDIIPLAKTLHAHGCKLHSFHGPDVLNASAHVESAQLLDTPDQVLPSIRRAHLDHQQITPASAKALQSHAHRLGAWTVNNRPEYDRLIQLGVEIIITNTPLDFIRP